MGDEGVEGGADVRSRGCAGGGGGKAVSRLLRSRCAPRLGPARLPLPLGEEAARLKGELWERLGWRALEG